ncbi:MAG TPA: VOC family protein [Gammaproteobacteria bacterium]|nr:VOC family protein [Gammaproteobacteria bacterium]
MRSAALFIAGVLVGAILLNPSAAQNPRVHGLNHVGLVVPDYDKAFAYYTQKLGFREAYTLRRADGGVQLSYLQLNRNTFVELIPAGANQPPGITHFGIEVEDLDAEVATLRAAGLTVADPGLTPAKARFVRVNDPNGVQIEIMQFGTDSLQRKAIDGWK